MTTLSFDENEPFATEAWKQKMSVPKDILKANKVRLLFLVHGTFAGDDAFGLLDLLEPVNKTLADVLRKKGKRFIDKLAKDVGNYSPEYANALGNALDIPCELFVWGSANFHLARLKGVTELAQAIAQKIIEHQILPNERILLQGHSHAGQLFALLTSFLAHDQQALDIYTLMEKYSDLRADKKSLLPCLEIIKSIYLDFVSFGTPIRYSWGDYERFRLMPVVNHRSGVQISGLLSTRDGDYIQQWYVEGSDMLPARSKIKVNDEFDVILDKGRDASLMLASLKREERRHPHYANGQTVNETFFVDYKDNALFPVVFLNPFRIPHCITTMLGHGVYTRTGMMLFNMNMIVKNFY